MNQTATEPAPAPDLNHVYYEVANERAAQDEKWGGPAHDDRHGTAEWVAFIARHAGLAVNDGRPESLERFRRQMIRVAALAIAAVESHDRVWPMAGKVYALREGNEGRTPTEQPHE